jgi:hypothetical protein
MPDTTQVLQTRINHHSYYFSKHMDSRQQPSATSQPSNCVVQQQSTIRSDCVDCPTKTVAS